jgi:hypothetical protein
MVSKTRSTIIKVFIQFLFLRSPRRWILHLAFTSSLVGHAVKRIVVST